MTPSLAENEHAAGVSLGDNVRPLNSKSAIDSGTPWNLHHAFIIFSKDEVTFILKFEDVAVPVSVSAKTWTSIFSSPGVVKAGWRIPAANDGYENTTVGG